MGSNDHIISKISRDLQSQNGFRLPILVYPTKRGAKCFSWPLSIHKLIRKISTRLRHALEWRCYEFETKASIPFIFKSEFNDSFFYKEFSDTVFRILQKSLTNASRSAETSEAAVLIRSDENIFVPRRILQKYRMQY